MLATDTQHKLNEFNRRGFVGATAERMAKSAEPFRSVLSTEKVKDGNGLTRVVNIETQLLQDWPLLRLWKSGAFGRDEVVAKARHDAGEAYYQAFFHGKLYPLGSRDYRKPYTGNSSDPYSLAPSQERAEHARQKYREMDYRLKLGQIIADRVWRATQMIVIDEMEPAEVGFIVSARKDKAQARAVAVEFLIEGLDRLRRR